MKRLMVAATLTAGMVFTAMPADASTAPRSCERALDTAEEIFALNADAIGVAIEMVEYLDPSVPYDAAVEADLEDRATEAADEVEVLIDEYMKYSSRCRAAS